MASVGVRDQLELLTCMMLSSGTCVIFGALTAGVGCVFPAGLICFSAVSQR